MTPQQVRGMTVFFGKASATPATKASTSRTNMYENLGVGTDKPIRTWGGSWSRRTRSRLGRFQDPDACGRSRKTAPYMHDGSLKTLEDVVDFYDKGGIPNKNLDKTIRKLQFDGAGEEGSGRIS